MDVSVVTPNWNGLRFLQPLFEDFAKQSQSPAEVIVVDNGSDDGSPQWARSAGARVIAFESNRGFATAVNAGVRAAEHDLVAILNNDLRLHPQWLEAVTLGMGAGAFAVGKVLSLSAPDRIDGTFDAVCRGGTAWRCGAGSPDGPVWAQPREVRIPPFTAILVRRNDFLAVGGLEEAFGSYLEDVDFGLRCASKGYSGRYVPDAVSWHAGSATLGRWHARTVRQIARNQVFLVARHYSGTLLRRYGWKIAVAHLLWGALAIRHGRGLSWVGGKVEGIRRCREMRGVPGLSVAEVLESGERDIRSLQRVTGQDLYWRLYFALT